MLKLVTVFVFIILPYWNALILSLKISIKRQLFVLYLPSFCVETIGTVDDLGIFNSN